MYAPFNLTVSRIACYKKVEYIFDIFLVYPLFSGGKKLNFQGKIFLSGGLSSPDMPFCFVPIQDLFYLPGIPGINVRQSIGNVLMDGTFTYPKQPGYLSHCRTGFQNMVTNFHHSLFYIILHLAAPLLSFLSYFYEDIQLKMTNYRSKKEVRFYADFLIFLSLPSLREDIPGDPGTDRLTEGQNAGILPGKHPDGLNPPPEQ